MCFKPHSYGCWQLSSPPWLLTGDISSLLCESAFRVTQNMAVCFPQSESSKSENKRRKMRQKSQYFCNIILEMTYYHFCHCLFVTSRSTQSHGQGEEIGCLSQSVFQPTIHVPSTCKNILTFSQGQFCNSETTLYILQI